MATAKDPGGNRFVVVDGLGRLPQFSHASVAGDWIFISGTLGTLPGGMALAPARITLSVADLALGASVEIECVARKTGR